MKIVSERGWGVGKWQLNERRGGLSERARARDDAGVFLLFALDAAQICVCTSMCRVLSKRCL